MQQQADLRQAAIGCTRDVDLPNEGAPKAAGRGQTLACTDIAEPGEPQTG